MSAPSSSQYELFARAEKRSELEFPAISNELLAALERAFPDRCPDGDLSDAEIRERIGECRVVRFLKRCHQRQQRAKQGRIL